MITYAVEAKESAYPFFFFFFFFLIIICSVNFSKIHEYSLPAANKILNCEFIDATLFVVETSREEQACVAPTVAISCFNVSDVCHVI